MLNPADIREAIITKLKAYTPLTAVVTANEIREVQWQSHDFVYPNVRVALKDEIPIGQADDCREDNSTYIFHVLTYSEKDSSLECETILYLVRSALSGATVSPASGKSGVVRTVRVIHPIREQLRVWRGQLIFQVNVYAG